MLRADEKTLLKSFGDLRRLFYASFFFSLILNSLTTGLTVAYVLFGFGAAELNPVMALELKALGLWVVPFHVAAILAYYVLFYFTMKHTVMTGRRYRIWGAVLILIPILSAFDLGFDLRSVL
jgi:hypothetical protein